ncbi:tail fiber protein [Enterobacter phage 01_vB_Eclo_IJM]|nr:tail fiber protein [Enterobacter phage 01_vB_Eclo_IJM]
MAKSTITQFPAGNTQYKIEFDYLARPFVVVTLVNSTDQTKNTVLTVGRDYRFLNPTTVEILITQSGFDILRIHRQTGTDLVVDFRNGSVLTASDLTNAELQAIHIAEEGRDQTVDLAKEYSDAAGTSAGNAKDSEDEARRIAESIKTAGLLGMLPSLLRERLQRYCVERGTAVGSGW